MPDAYCPIFTESLYPPAPEPAAGSLDRFVWLFSDWQRAQTWSDAQPAFQQALHRSTSYPRKSRHAGINRDGPPRRTYVLHLLRIPYGGIWLAAYDSRQAR